MSNHLSLTSFLSKCILGFLATLLMGTAISLFLACNLGSDPITVFLDGFHKKTGVSVGVTDQFLNLILLVIGFVFNRKAIGIQSVINVFVLGVCIDVPTHFIKYFNSIDCYIICTGMFWIKFCMDAIFFRIIKKFHCKYMTIRIIYDGIYLIIGFLLGGIVGVGTILSITTNGFFTEKAKQVIELLQDGDLKIWMKKQFSQQ